jgi:protein MpaA
MAHSPIHSRSFGRSVHGRPLVAFCNSDRVADSILQGPPADWEAETQPTLILGGIHGNEPATVHLLQEFLEPHLGALRVPVVVVPLCNPDGHALDSRYNARGVDLNRNCGHQWASGSLEPSGPAPWSEPESCALRDLILNLRPRHVLSLHWALGEIDADGTQSRGCAEAMWSALSHREKAPYRLRVTERAPVPASDESACPGSLGQWCGFSLEFAPGVRPAMVTLELPHDPEIPGRPPDLPEDHLDTLRQRWSADAAGYLDAVRDPVWKMLLAACHHSLGRSSG